MVRWLQTGLALLVLATGFSGLPQAEAAPVTQVSPLSTDLADILVILSGTAAVFDSQRLQAALQDPEPLLGSNHKFDLTRVKGLLKEAGYRPWTERPTLWVVQPAVDNSLSLLAAVPRFYAEAKARGLPLSQVRPTSNDVTAVAEMAKGNERSVLPAFLTAHQAEALVVLDTTEQGYHWRLLQAGRQLEGDLPVDADVPALLPHVLAEALAASFQWPEASGRPLVHVRNVGNMTQFVAVQTALQQLKGVRGLSLVRVDGSNAYFAVDAPTGAELAAVLDTDARLTPEKGANPAIRPLFLQGRKYGSPVQARVWAADNVPADKPLPLQ